MMLSVLRATAVIAVAAIGLGACTDTTPWAYPTEPGATAQRPATVEPEGLPITRPAPGRIAPRQLVGAAPPVSTYVAPQTVAVAPELQPVVVPSAIPAQPLPAPRAVVAPAMVAPVAVTPMAITSEAFATATVPAPATVYVPEAPPLFEKSGLIDIVLSNSAGQPDGLILKDETMVHFSPAFAAAMDPDGSRLAPGRPIIVRGTWNRDRHKHEVLTVAEMGTDVYSMVAAY